MGKRFKALGPDSLKTTVFTLTLINDAPPILRTETFQRNSAEWCLERITNVLEKVIRVAFAIRVVPVGYRNEPTPSSTSQQWLKLLQSQCLEVMPRKSAEKMAANARLKPGPYTAVSSLLFFRQDKDLLTCPVCEIVIADGSKQIAEHDVVKCSGVCSTSLHREGEMKMSVEDAFHHKLKF